MKCKKIYLNIHKKIFYDLSQVYFFYKSATNKEIRLYCKVKKFKISIKHYLVL